MNRSARPGRGRIPHHEDSASYLLPLLPIRGVRLGFSQRQEPPDPRGTRLLSGLASCGARPVDTCSR